LFHFETKQLPEIDSMAGMNMNQSTLPTLKPGEQLWGIYYTDREYAREMGNPLLGVIAAPTKAAAEESAIKQGLPDSWAHPLSADQIKSIRESTIRRLEQPHTTMQPSTAELRTAIEVLQMLEGRMTEQAFHSLKQQPKSELGEHYAGNIAASAIEQISQVGKVCEDLQNWREELLQRQQQRVAHTV
jgi:hypothetical protein